MALVELICYTPRHAFGSMKGGADVKRKITKLIPTIPVLPVKRRVAAYARVSSGKDASLHSLSAQISYYSNYIQRHRGWEYAGVYADEAVTGTKDTREDFRRLLSDCEDGLIDLIITKSISRFARNTVTLLETVRKLREKNIEIYFERENIYSMSGDGELMLTILASFAQEESRSVSENVKWRIRKRFEDGELVNLRFMYGYKIKNGKIAIDPEQAEVVRMIFTDYINGMGCTLISKKLREMGIQKLRGGNWNAERVSEILRNEKYTGNALLQKKYVVDHLNKTLVWNKGVLPQYYAEGTHCAIIDIDTFIKVKEILTKNREHSKGKKGGGKYVFTSKVQCGTCGKKYKRKTSGGRIYWSCGTYLKYGKECCSSRQIPEHILQAVASEVFNQTNFDEAIFEQLIEKVIVSDNNKLIFLFRDGHSVEKTWENKSKSESWTEEMKQKARERLNERRSLQCVQQNQ